MMRGERLSCCADGFEALLLAPAEARAAYPLVRLGFPAVSLPDWNRFARRANRGARCRRGLVAIIDGRGVIHAVFAYSFREGLGGRRALGVNELVMGRLPGGALHKALIAALEELAATLGATCLRVDLPADTLAAEDRDAFLAAGFRTEGDHLSRACRASPPI